MDSQKLEQLAQVLHIQSCQIHDYFDVHCWQNKTRAEFSPSFHNSTHIKATITALDRLFEHAKKAETP